MARRWQQVRAHTGRESRRWRHGVERAQRVGYRARQRQEQEAVRFGMGLRVGGCRHEYEEEICARVARELGESGRHPELHEEVSGC